MPSAESREQRFWSRVQMAADPTACWTWSGAVGSSGGGVFAEGPKQFCAHKVAWELENATKVPRGQRVAQRCGNRLCCNPNHLELSPKVAPLSTGPGTRIYGKLKDNIVPTIRTDYAAGATIAVLAERYKVSLQTIFDIVHGRSHRRDGGPITPVGTNRGELNKLSKMTADKVRALKHDLAGGMTQAAAAKKYGVTQTAVSAVHTGKTWTHVTD